MKHALIAAILVLPQETSDVRERALELGRAYVSTVSETASLSKREIHDARPELERRRASIEHEMRTLPDHEWAGTYVFGDGTGTNVVVKIAPGSGAYYTWTGCLGLYDLNHGEVVDAEHGRVRIAWHLDTEQNRRLYQASRPTKIVSDEWIVVPWADTRYLVPTSRMIPFCNDVSSGKKLHSHARLLRPGERPSLLPPPRPEGLPSVPPEYEPFVLSEPIEAAVLGVGEVAFVGTYVGGKPKYRLDATIDAGDLDGLLPGMLLYVVEPVSFELAQVIDVEPHRAHVQFHSSRFDDREKVPAHGWRLSTRRPEPYYRR